MEHLLEDGADVVVTDVHAPTVDRGREAHPEVRTGAGHRRPRRLDSWTSTPPARWATPSPTTWWPVLSARIVCGAANNQLAHPGVEKQLDDRGILYAPDYVVNAGGLIQVADELHGFDFERARERASHIFDTTREVFTLADSDGVPPAVAADRIAEQRMSAGADRGIWLPGDRT